jgi:Cft2 family RNA processing exonuclease
MEARASKELMYNHLKDCVVPVPHYESFTIETQEHGMLKLMFFPANHCPGASL